MIELAEDITLEGYNPLEDLASLKGMFTSYLLEEFERTGEMAFGNPVAGYLVTFMIRCAGLDAGFLSLDFNRRSVEVIYVKSEFRGRKLATLALKKLNQDCPQTLALKTPLSPGGEALVLRLGLDRADNAPEDTKKMEDALQDIQRNIKASCSHKRRASDPRKSCTRCYKKGLRRYAQVVIGGPDQGSQYPAVEFQPRHEGF